MAKADTNSTYTISDRSQLMGTGQIDDLLLYRLIEMASCDQQSATVTINPEDQSVTIVQTPHQGDPTTSLHYLPTNEIVEKWLDSEEERTANAEIYDWDADEVAEIRADIQASRDE